MHASLVLFFAAPQTHTGSLSLDPAGDFRSRLPVLSFLANSWLRLCC